MKRIIIISLIAVALVALTVTKLMANKTKAEQKIYIHDADAEILVEEGKPTTHTFESSLSFLGTFEPVRQNTIGSDAQGKVISLNVDEGDYVSKGQLIAKVDDEMLELQIQNADISIEGQKNDDARYTNLSKENAVAGMQVEKTKLGLRTAENQKKQLQKQLRNTNIRAPFSGTITKKMIDVGSFLGNGSPVVEITDISSLKLTINVPERDILKFKQQQNVIVKADIYGNRTFEGKVTNISVQADKSHNFEVQITVKNPGKDLMAGMYGSVSLSNNKSVSALAVPRKALVGSSKHPQVYVIRDGKAVLISFTSGTSDGDYIEVVNGIRPSDRIVVKGQVNLQDNSRVKTTK